MSLSIAQLQKITDEQLIAAHDKHAANTMVGTQFFLDEMQRRSQTRSQEKQEAINAQMLNYTAKMFTLTKVVTWLTVASLVVSLVALTISVVSLNR